ncbi:MAG: hypothetical protein FWE21_09540 [Defluviitaleaceae bacterium]|nr:hypothetical protein [Defluviitaleaceae bacterium]
MQISGIQQYFLHYPAEQEELVLFIHGGPVRPHPLRGIIKAVLDFLQLSLL